MISSFSASRLSTGHAADPCRLPQGAYAVNPMSCLFSRTCSLLMLLAALFCMAAPAHAADPVGTAITPVTVQQPLTPVTVNQNVQLNNTIPSTNIPGNTDCSTADGVNPKIAKIYEKGGADAMARDSTITEQLMRSYNPQAYTAGACIRKLIDLVVQIGNTLNSVSSSFHSPFVAMVAVAISQILVTVLNQVINNIVNAVCSAANQIYSFLDSVTKNLLCIPAIKGINPFDFNIDLKALQCDGWSIDLLSGNVIGSPVEGLNVNLSNLSSEAKAVQSAVDGGYSTPAQAAAAAAAAANAGNVTTDDYKNLVGSP